MSIEGHWITVGGLRVDVVRKPIKNLHLGVYPPHGRVRVAAPLTVSDEAVRLAVVTRMGWIKRQQQKFEAQERQSPRRFESGETHYFLGRRYRLNVIEQPGISRIALRGVGTIELFVPGSDPDARERVFQSWYRRELRKRAAPLINKWAEKMELPIPWWGIKRMKTKWGSCSPDGGRVWINSELIKKPLACIEYVVAHELAHFHFRNHDEKFVALLDRSLPQWRILRDELNAQPLGHEEWTGSSESLLSRQMLSTSR